MHCNFDLCEFYNVVLGGLLIGVITSFVFIWLTNLISQYNFLRKYKYLRSAVNDFDWTAYSMRAEDGRVREDIPNGSIVNIEVKRNKIYIRLQHDSKDSNGNVIKREWRGELIMSHNNFGVVSYKYIDKHEYGRKECVIGEFEEQGQKFDYFFLIPLENKLYYLETQSEGKLRPLNNYGNEILIRKKSAPTEVTVT